MERKRPPHILEQAVVLEGGEEEEEGEEGEEEEREEGEEGDINFKNLKLTLGFEMNQILADG